MKPLNPSLPLPLKSCFDTSPHLLAGSLFPAVGLAQRISGCCVPEQGGLALCSIAGLILQGQDEPGAEMLLLIQSSSCWSLLPACGAIR